MDMFGYQVAESLCRVCRAFVTAQLLATDLHTEIVATQGSWGWELSPGHAKWVGQNVTFEDTGWKGELSF